MYLEYTYVKKVLHIYYFGPKGRRVLDFAKRGGTYVMYSTSTAGVHSPPNHLQVVPRHYHGDGNKFLCFLGHDSSNMVENQV